MPFWLCIKKWLVATERRRLGNRERKRLKKSRTRYYDDRFDILMDFIESTDVVDIICGGYLDESKSNKENDTMIISFYNINAKYLEYY